MVDIQCRQDGFGCRIRGGNFARCPGRWCCGPNFARHTMYRAVLFRRGRGLRQPQLGDFPHDIVGQRDVDCPHVLRQVL